MKMSRAGMNKFLKRSQDQLVELWPAEVTIGGVTYPAACVGERSEGTLEAGGYEMDVDLVVKVSKSELAKKPKDGARITYKDVPYRIKRVPNLIEPSWTIYCVDKNAK